jgi:hypothetical protein
MPNSVITHSTAMPLLKSRQLSLWVLTEVSNCNGPIRQKGAQEDPMVNRKLLWVAMLLALSATAAWAQFIPDPDVQGKINHARQEISLRGKIGHADGLGGYYLNAGTAGHKIILNQNYDTLKNLARHRQEVKIQGRTDPFDLQARYLFIEKIDGKPYHGDKAPVVKPPTRLKPLF